MNGIIYKYTNKINGKSYIGLTTEGLKQRNRRHIMQQNDGTAFHSAIKKYGRTNFDLQVIDSADDYEELKEKEIYWIKHFNTYMYSKNSHGYNMTPGGDGSMPRGHKEVVQVSAENGKIKQKYVSIKSAAEITKASSGSISSICNFKGRVKTTKDSRDGKRYFWRFAPYEEKPIKAKKIKRFDWDAEKVGFLEMLNIEMKSLATPKEYKEWKEKYYEIHKTKTVGQKT